VLPPANKRFEDRLFVCIQAFSCENLNEYVFRQLHNVFVLQGRFRMGAKEDRCSQLERLKACNMVACAEHRADCPGSQMLLQELAASFFRGNQLQVIGSTQDLHDDILRELDAVGVQELEEWFRRSNARAWRDL
jgi:hypothetical protein